VLMSVKNSFSACNMVHTLQGYGTDCTVDAAKLRALCPSLQDNRGGGLSEFQK